MLLTVTLRSQDVELVFLAGAFVFAALGLLVSSGRATDPFAMLRAAFGGGGAEQQEAQWDFEEDEFDDFSED